MFSYFADQALDQECSDSKCKCICLLSDIPVNSADFTIYTPGIGTLSYMVSSPLGIFCS